MKTVDIQVAEGWDAAVYPRAGCASHSGDRAGSRVLIPALTVNPEGYSHKAKNLALQSGHEPSNFNILPRHKTAMSSTSTPGLWDSQSNLLLLQLIYKYGDPSDSVPEQEKLAVFDKIASQLSAHTLIRPSKRKYTGAVRIPLRRGA